MKTIQRIMRPVRQRTRRQQQDRLGMFLIAVSLAFFALWFASAAYLDFTR